MSSSAAPIGDEVLPMEAQNKEERARPHPTAQAGPQGGEGANRREIKESLPT